MLIFFSDEIRRDLTVKGLLLSAVLSTAPLTFLSTSGDLWSSGGGLGSSRVMLALGILFINAPGVTTVVR